MGPGRAGETTNEISGRRWRLPGRGGRSKAPRVQLPLAAQAPPSARGRGEPPAAPRQAPSRHREDGSPRRAAVGAPRAPESRDAVAFEEVPAGFRRSTGSEASREAGWIRRGHFVAGLGGLQFADPGALDRLRALREPAPDESQAVVLAAADPANPCGAALAWPKSDDARLARVAGPHVVLVDGAIAAVVSRGARQVTALLPDEEPARSHAAAAAARALRHWCEVTSRSALGWAVGEGPALAESPLAPFLAEAGFVRSGPGFCTPRDSSGANPEGLLLREP